MSSFLVTQLERDANIIRALLLVRARLFSIHGAKARLSGETDVVSLDNRMELRAIDATLASLGAAVQRPYPDEV